MNWREIPWIAFDVETTGLGPERDRILQFGAVVYDPVAAEFVGRLSFFCSPDGVPIHPAAYRVHGLTVEMLAGFRPFDECLPLLLDLLRWLPSPCVFVAYSAPFDCGFLAASCRRAGLVHPPPSCLEEVVDPLVFARALFPSADNRLGSLARRLGLASEGPHGALGDAITTIRCLRELSRRMTDRVPTDLDRLLGLQAKLAEARKSLSGPG